MAATPKKKHTKSRTGKRRGGHGKLALPNLSPCSNCNKPKLPHSVCTSCGKY